MTDELQEFIDAGETGEQEVETEATAEVETQEAVTETGTPETEAKAEDTESEKESEVTPTEETSGEPWTKKAYLDEKRKRQELEQRLEALEAGKREPEQAPDVFESQEAYTQYLQDQQRRLVGQAKLEISQDMMRSAHPDYDELESEFLEMAQGNPALAADLVKAANPARFAYETAMKARQAKELENIDSYKEKLRAEVKEQLLAEMKAEQEKTSTKEAEKLKATAAPSLAAVTGAAGAVDDSEDSLESLTRLG